ncbi:MAG: HD domain-containing phosphohydrolase [Candidatus Omnitrophota bacterium]
MAGKTEKKKIVKTDKNTILWGIFFKKLLQNFEAMVAVVDPGGRIIFANEKYVAVFRPETGNVFGKEWIKISIPANRHTAARVIFGKLEKGKNIQCIESPSSARCGKMSWFCIPLADKKSFYNMIIGREIKGKRAGVPGPGISASQKPGALSRMIINDIFNASRASDPHTAEHSERVMLFAVKLAKELKMDNTSIVRLKIASLLHDLGKLAVDRKILLKKGKLTRREFLEIKKHPRWGAEIVGLIYFLRDIIPIMVKHHENFDGSGYPEGIAKNNIPLEARILSVADIYEALTADRPYRKGFSREEAIAIMKSEKGKKLDPEITDIFIGMLNSGKIKG